MVWSSDCTDSPAVVINHTKHQPSSSSSSTSTSSGILSAVGSSSSPCTKVSSFTTYTAAIAAVNSSIKKSDSRNRPFGAEVNCARFFYMDKFIMLVSKSLSPSLTLSYYLLFCLSVSLFPSRSHSTSLFSTSLLPLSHFLSLSLSLILYLPLSLILYFPLCLPLSIISQ